MKRIFTELLQTMQQDITADILTLIDATGSLKDNLGQMMLILPDGSTQGQIVSSEAAYAVKQAVAAQSWHGPRVIEIPKYSLQVFWNRSERKRRAVIAGGGHISLPLTQILAIAGFEVCVIDDRPEFAYPGRFPGARQVICRDFASALQSVDVSGSTAMIIVTRGHRYDLDCLRAVIRSKPYYLGMIGSQRRIRSIMEQLREQGYEDEFIKQLKAPIGLDIGAQTPEEIAVSIAAEVIAAFRGGNYLPLSSRAVKHCE